MNDTKTQNLTPKSKNITITQIYIRYYETDRMKIVHHSNYFRYFEISRCEFFSQNIIPYSILEEKYYLLSPVISAKASFYKPLKFEDILSIATFIYYFDKIKVKFQYIGILGKFNNIEELLENKKNNLVCIGETEHVFVNSKTFKPTRPKVFIEEKGEMLDKIISAAVAQLDQSM